MPAGEVVRGPDRPSHTQTEAREQPFIETEEDIVRTPF